MDKSKRQTYLNANAVAAQIAAPGNFNDDPYAIELERRDLLPADNVLSNNATTFMTTILDHKKSLLKEAEFVLKSMRNDEITVGDGKITKTKKVKAKSAKKKAVSVQADKPKKVLRRANISDDDEVDGGEAGDDVDMKDELDPEKAAEEDSDDEEPPEEEDLEEVRIVFILELSYLFYVTQDNDYMDAHFDNGEDYAD